MPDRPAFIIGNGEHARVIAAILGRHVKFVVARPQKADEVARELVFADKWRPDEIDVYIGVGNNADRRAEFERLQSVGLKAAICIASNAWISGDAAIGEGTVICPGAVIGAGAMIGQNAIVNTLSSVDHDCAVGDDTHISPGVTIGGGVKIGRRCFFGIKSGVVSHISIGDDVSVMAGSLVAKSLPNGVMAGGNPARIMRGAAPFGDAGGEV